MKNILIVLFFLPFISSSQTMATTAGSDGRLIVTNVDVPAGNTIANTTAETAFASTIPVIPTTMWVIGKHIRITFAGYFSTAIVVPSLTGKVKIGSTVIGTTGAITTVGSLSSRGWNGYLDIVIHSLGASGTMDVQGCIIIQTTAGACITLPIVNTSDITVDMTTSQSLSLTAQWGAVSTSNTITLRQLIFEF